MADKLYLAATKKTDASVSEIREYELSAVGVTNPNIATTAPYRVMFEVPGRPISCLQFARDTPERLYFVQSASGSVYDWTIGYLLSGQTATYPPFKLVLTLGNSGQEFGPEFVLLPDDSIWVPRTLAGKQGWNYYNAAGVATRAVVPVTVPSQAGISPATPNPLIGPYWVSPAGTKIRCFRRIIRTDLTPALSDYAYDLQLCELNPTVAVAVVGDWPAAVTEVNGGRLTFEQAGHINLSLVAPSAQNLNPPVALHTDGRAFVWTIATTRPGALVSERRLQYVSIAGALR